MRPRSHRVPRDVSPLSSPSEYGTAFRTRQRFAPKRPIAFAGRPSHCSTVA